MPERVKMGLDEEIIREYPLHKSCENKRHESAYLTVTNKRIIYAKSSKEARRRTTELRDIPLSSVDTVESFLKEQRLYSPLVIVFAALLLISGVAVAVLVSLGIGIALTCASVITVVLLLTLTRSEYNFYLSIGTLGRREVGHLSFGASAIAQRVARQSTRHRIRVAINGAEIDKLVAELGAIIIRFKEES
ncbi:MAG: hypothetical protein IJX97_03950 [Clostridia bacterium]|nr:hypothetical protein [Clostridia bacterium]MBQ8720105.1 hypothetical protein [Clostridia bacterium]